jgi:transcriptional regulator with XRE-family HTH domain
MARKRRGEAWTPNQIVAYNVAQARLLRGWTQEQAAEALAPYLGTRWSAASFSAVERSVAGGGIREFTADELLALARGFRLPIGWFLTPPSHLKDVDLSVPDSKGGADRQILLDAVLGTPETLEPWEQVLLAWPAGAGTTSSGERDVPDVDGAIEDLAATRARMLLRQSFGNLDQARDVLERLRNVLDQLEAGDVPAGRKAKRERSHRQEG